MKDYLDFRTIPACLFVASSDRTRDVFDQVYAGFGKLWPYCPWPRYVGLTTAVPEASLHGFTPIATGVECGWRGELNAQIQQLPPEISHIILMLDDFLLLKPVDQSVLAAALAEAITQDLAYARLVPVERSLPVRLLRNLGTRQFFEPLAHNEPYPSSLQATLWKRDYLLEALRKPGSIWDFEHQRGAPGQHHAATRRLIQYRHVVERGKWMPYTRRLFHGLGMTFDAGSRPMHSLSHGLRWHAHKLLFAFAGYGLSRLKRALRARP